MVDASRDDPQQPEHPTTRSDKRLIAYIAGGAALFGAAIGVVGSIIAAQITSDAFDKRTQRDFLHQQRAAAYASFLTSAEELQTTTNQYIRRWQDTAGRVRESSVLSTKAGSAEQAIENQEPIIQLLSPG